jgi:antitoxin VapB
MAICPLWDTLTLYIVDSYRQAGAIEAMALTIRHAEAERLANELARETGEPVAQVILEALKQRANALRDQRAESLAAARIQRAARRCAALPDRETTPADRILGYAPDGTFECWTNTLSKRAEILLSTEFLSPELRA